MNNKKIETICLNGGYVPGNGQPRQLPIYQSTTYKYDTSADMAKLFDLDTCIPDWLTQHVMLLQLKSQLWKVVQQQC